VDTILAIAGGEGYIILWNYIKKGDPIAHHYGNYNKSTRDKPKEKSDGKGKDGKADRSKLYTCIAFTPDGSELIVCQSDGNIKVMDMKTSQFKETSQVLKVSDNQNKSAYHYYINQIEMCNDGPYFATADISRCVSLFKKDYIFSQGAMDTDRPQEWQFAGKIKSHSSDIASISFGKSIDENDQV
jgi:WD40 repeat protein